MTVFFTSDLHIGHKKVAGIRGFFAFDDGPENPPTAEDPVAHDEAIAAYWDATVKRDDIVFVLGDTGMSNFGYVLEWFDARPGIKHLVAGNHDPVHPARSDAVRLQKRWLQTFDTINPYVSRKIGGEKVMLCHFPYESWGDGPERGGTESSRWNEWRVPESLGKKLLHGHTHGTEVAHDNMLHVGWDAHHRFLSQEEVALWVQTEEFL